MTSSLIYNKNKQEVMPNREYFYNDISGSRKRLTHLLNKPDLLNEIFEWRDKYGLEELDFIEQVYHYANDLKELPIDKKSGKLKYFYGFRRGYRKKLREDKEKMTLDRVKTEFKNLQNSGGSISQRIKNNPDLLFELREKYPFDLSDRAKIYMLIHDIDKIPKCKVCDNDTRFGNSKGFIYTCSEECRRILEQIPRSKIIKFGDRTVRVQGYEEEVLMDLVMKFGYSKDDILVNDEIIKELGKAIQYEDGLYYPDIYIKSENKIIEVKSSYTYRVDLEKNFKKRKGSLDMGFNFEFHVWDLQKIIKENEK